MYGERLKKRKMPTSRTSTSSSYLVRLSSLLDSLRSLRAFSSQSLEGGKSDQLPDAEELSLDADHPCAASVSLRSFCDVLSVLCERWSVVGHEVEIESLYSRVRQTLPSHPAGPQDRTDPGGDHTSVLKDAYRVMQKDYGRSVLLLGAYSQGPCYARTCIYRQCQLWESLVESCGLSHYQVFVCVLECALSVSGVERMLTFIGIMIWASRHLATLAESIMNASAQAQSCPKEGTFKLITVLVNRTSKAWDSASRLDKTFETDRQGAAGITPFSDIGRDTSPSLFLEALDALNSLFEAISLTEGSDATLVYLARLAVLSSSADKPCKAQPAPSTLLPSLFQEFISQCCIRSIRNGGIIYPRDCDLIMANADNSVECLATLLSWLHPNHSLSTLAQGSTGLLLSTSHSASGMIPSAFLKHGRFCFLLKVFSMTDLLSIPLLDHMGLQLASRRSSTFAWSLILSLISGLISWDGPPKEKALRYLVSRVTHHSRSSKDLVKAMLGRSIFELKPILGEWIHALEEVQRKVKSQVEEKGDFSSIVRLLIQDLKLVKASKSYPLSFQILTQDDTMKLECSKEDKVEDVSFNIIRETLEGSLSVEGMRRWLNFFVAKPHLCKAIISNLHGDDKGRRFLSDVLYLVRQLCSEVGPNRSFQGASLLLNHLVWMRLPGWDAIFTELSTPPELLVNAGRRTRPLSALTLEMYLNIFLVGPSLPDLSSLSRLLLRVVCTSAALPTSKGNQGILTVVEEYKDWLHVEPVIDEYRSLLLYLTRVSGSDGQDGVKPPDWIDDILPERFSEALVGATNFLLLLNGSPWLWSAIFDAQACHCLLVSLLGRSLDFTRLELVLRRILGPCPQALTACFGLQSLFALYTVLPPGLAAAKSGVRMLYMDIWSSASQLATDYPFETSRNACYKDPQEEALLALTPFGCLVYKPKRGPSDPAQLWHLVISVSNKSNYTNVTEQFKESMEVTHLMPISRTIEALYRLILIRSAPPYLPVVMPSLSILFHAVNTGNFGLPSGCWKEFWALMMCTVYIPMEFKGESALGMKEYLRIVLHAMVKGGITLNEELLGAAQAIGEVYSKSRSSLCQLFVLQELNILVRQGVEQECEEGYWGALRTLVEHLPLNCIIEPEPEDVSKGLQIIDEIAETRVIACHSLILVRLLTSLGLVYSRTERQRTKVEIETWLPGLRQRMDSQDWVLLEDFLPVSLASVDVDILSTPYFDVLCGHLGNEVDTKMEDNLSDPTDSTEDGDDWADLTLSL